VAVQGSKKEKEKEEKKSRLLFTSPLERNTHQLTTSFLKEPTHRRR
jgi:hypothetical protein